MQSIKQYLQKLLQFINKNRDKQLHFFYIFFFTRIYTLLLVNQTQFFIISTSFIIMIGISIFKQFIDLKIINKKFDYKDILAGMLGWLISMFLTIIQIKIYK